MPRGLTVFGDRSLQVTGRSWSRKLIPDSQGALVDNLIVDGETYRRYVWENSGQLIPQTEETDVDVLIIGGGGGGGGDRGGGGGAGELIHKENYTISQEVSITVGDGGAGGSNDFGENGSNSSFGSLVALGGGGGAPHGSEGKDGGSGGGGGCNENNGGLSIADTGVGYAGGYGPVNWSSAGAGGGGGGAGSTGDTPEGGSGYVSHPGNGGEGVDLSGVFGDDYGQNGLFAGGGGGGTEGYHDATNTSAYQRPIGKAGGGDGGRIEYNSSNGYNEDDGTDAKPYTGAGGGGGNFSENTATSGGDGGFGIVIARYGPI
jgi:hypothetical protein